MQGLYYSAIIVHFLLSNFFLLFAVNKKVVKNVIKLISVCIDEFDLVL